VVTEYKTQNGPLPTKGKPIQENLKEKSIAGQWFPPTDAFHTKT